MRKRLGTLFVLVCGSILPAEPAFAAAVSTVATPTTLTGPVTITFDAPVKGVSPQNVTIRASGHTADRAGSVRCLGADGAAASCALGPVTKAIRSYTSILTPGQVYNAIVNPDGATPVTDMVGGAVVMKRKSFRAALSHQEDSPAVRFSWATFRHDSAFGDSFVAERSRGAKVSLRFSGDSITLYTRRAPNQGTATVYVDGDRLTTINNYSSTKRWKVPRTFRDLGAGAHTLSIYVDGRRGSTRGTDAYFSVDGWAQNGSLLSKPDETYRWAPVSDSAASGDRLARSDVPGARMRITFRGKGIDWYTVTGPTQGSAQMLIDGRHVKSVHNYSSTTHHYVRRGVAGLSDAVHTLTILPTLLTNGRRGFASIDYLLVRLPDTSMFKHLGTWVDVYDYDRNIATAAKNMADNKVDTVYLETARFSSSDAFDYDAKVGQWIEAAHANGMKVVGWYLPAYSEYMSVDVARTVAIANYRSPAGQRFDALAIDIEYKGKTSSLAEWNEGIRSHLAQVRARVGNAYPIGAIFPSPVAMEIYPSHWTGFPWSSIARYADVALPMAYWSYRTDCATKPQHCSYEYARGNVKKSRAFTGLPVHIIGGIANDVTTTEVRDFRRGAIAELAYGGGLYDYVTTYPHPGYWTELAPLAGG